MLIFLKFVDALISSELSNSPINEELGAETLLSLVVRPLGFGEAGLALASLSSYAKLKNTSLIKCFTFKFNF